MVISVNDGFQNLIAGMGAGAANLNSSATYAFTYYTRQRVLLEAMYRGTWIVNKVVNIVADDMTRAGITLSWPGKPENPGIIQRAMRRLHVWTRINSGLRWARLYGGAIGVLMIDGQAPGTPLNIKTIPKRGFRGIHIMDRWMVTPSTEIVTEIGPHFGLPKSYQVAYGPGVPFSGHMIDHTRVIRFEGLELPYWQKQTEMGWGLSIIEPLYDRMIGFDTVTSGMSNLVHKAHLRVLKIKELRNIIAAGGPQYEALLKNLHMIRALQTSEGITLLDAEDIMEFHNYTFAGLSDVAMQKAQELCGAADLPITRLFGQAPAGLNSTGDSDLRNHYDKIKQEQESRLDDPMETLINCTAMSECGEMLPEDGTFSFNPLWQLSDTEKADIAAKDTATTVAGKAEGLVSDKQALTELQNSSKITGRWTSITDEDVNAADADIPEPPDMHSDIPGNESGVKLPAPGKGAIPGTEEMSGQVGAS